jgi:hypothetical protein
MSNSWIFTDEDALAPVYCLGCRNQVPKAMSNANSGFCDECLDVKIRIRSTPNPNITNPDPTLRAPARFFKTPAPSIAPSSAPVSANNTPQATNHNPQPTSAPGTGHQAPGTYYGQGNTFNFGEGSMGGGCNNWYGRPGGPRSPGARKLGPRNLFRSGTSGRLRTLGLWLRGRLFNLYSHLRRAIAPKSAHGRP